MNEKYEIKLALKITLVLFILLLMIFSIFIFSNYKLALKREKQIFLTNLKTVPANYIINVIEGKKNIINRRHPGKKIYKKIFQNSIIKIGNKEIVNGFFDEENIKNDILKKLKNKQIKVFKFSDYKILGYKLSSGNISIIVAKDISYIFDSINRLILISILLSIFSIFILYYISLNLAYKTTKNIKMANKKLREYNYNLAHELKTPLAVIKSDLELLEIGKKLDKYIIKSLKDEIISMQEIIDSLLFLTQKSNSIEKQKMNLTNLIKKIISNKFDKNLFNLNLQENVNKNISEKLFEILIKNLIENAIKYGNNNKKINIILTKKYLKIENFLREDNFKINKKKLFDSFYKADNSRHSEGFGLGLNIVKKITDLHNFQINIDIKNDLFIVIINF